ncbi:hypothetical protein QTH17_14740 [Clostridium perfringens]|uniref:hypothetical protein n=1 Tax=Clostridium perfringens TaxID=1502 RepID=UPI001A1F39EA|nr:hypothetical protein [Clostridium perfringens]HAT4181354.1 hypothetical protein [Clostridium perfringens]HBI6911313.1 hypothetical protein [Clostridium perfringens]HBI6922983.1 hypothetical protein [Clostridium perfringens]
MYSREENLKRIEELKENDFYVIVSKDNPVIVVINDNDVTAKDYMRIHVSRYYTPIIINSIKYRLIKKYGIIFFGCFRKE